MIISEVIKRLEELRKEHGDVRVTKYNCFFGEDVADVNPNVDYTVKGKTYWIQDVSVEDREETVIRV